MPQQVSHVIAGSEPSTGMSDLLVYGMQLEAPWVLSEPSSGMTDLLRHALANQD
jgi:hypothetical protein